MGGGARSCSSDSGDDPSLGTWVVVRGVVPQTQVMTPVLVRGWWCEELFLRQVMTPVLVRG